MNKRNLFTLSTGSLIALPPVVSLYSLRGALMPVLFADPSGAFLFGLVAGVCLTFYAIFLGTSIFEGGHE